MNILTKTADGSNTLFNQDIGEHYHSAHGALQESKHVFINKGLDFWISEPNTEARVLEVGFGTGLNFLLSYAYAEERKIKLNYTGIEAFPLSQAVIEETGYHAYVDEMIWQRFTSLYQPAMVDQQKCSSYCQFQIVCQKLQQFNSNSLYDIIYYDAFSVRHQPDMWADEIIAHTCSLLKNGGIFVTYAITGNLKRALKKCGLTVEKIPGPPGKREMLRAIKTR